MLRPAIAHSFDPWLPASRAAWAKSGLPAILAAYASPSRADSASRLASRLVSRNPVAAVGCLPAVASGTVEALLNGCERITSWLNSALPFTGPKAPT